MLRNLGKEKDWTRRGIDYLLQKIDATGSHERKKGSRRPRSRRTDENKEEVEDLSMSQEDPDTDEWKRHESPRKIALRLGVSKDTIYHIVHFFLVWRFDACLTSNTDSVVHLRFPLFQVLLYVYKEKYFPEPVLPHFYCLSYR